VGPFYLRTEPWKRALGEAENIDNLALLIAAMFIKEINTRTDQALREGEILAWSLVQVLDAEIIRRVDRLVLRPAQFEKDILEKFKNLGGSKGPGSSPTHQGKAAASGQTGTTQGAQANQLTSGSM
jgi:hypothetical protein